MSRIVSPNPKYFPDTIVQTRAKSARIQSQKPLSHESTLKPPFLLNKPLEVGVLTTSGFRTSGFLRKTQKIIFFSMVYFVQ